MSAQSLSVLFYRDCFKRYGSWVLAFSAIVLWEVAGLQHWVADGALPALSAVFFRLISEWGDYWPHIVATLKTSGLGFLIGNGIAYGCAVLFCLWPLAERMMRGLNIAIFAVPPIALVPVLVIALDGEVARVTLAALLVYFPSMTAALDGLSRIDGASKDLIRAYGGGDLKILWFLRLRSALPSIASGMKVAAPAALLGAILAEFGSGARWGLGTFLLGSLGRAEPDRIWGIGLTATALAGFGYFAAALLSHWATGSSRSLTFSVERPVGADPRSGLGRRLIETLLMIAVPFIIWQALIWWADLSPIIAKGPMGVWDYLVGGRTAESAQTRLLAALAETLPITILGMFAGLGVAFGLAVLSFTVPTVMRAILPFALVSQTMPLVALTPLAVLVFGRGVTVTLIITISVTFFAAFVVLAQGFAMLPKASFDLVEAYGGGVRRKLVLVAIPAALPHLFVAMRLALPKALLGVMIAEWLATGRGLGNLLNQSRGYLDYGMLWSVAFVSVVLAIGLYQLASLAEWLVRRRLAK